MVEFCICRISLHWQFLRWHHEHSFNAGTFSLLFFFLSFVESMSLCLNASSAWLVSYFMLSQYFLVVSSMMKTTSAVTLFQSSWIYVNLHYLYVWLHITVYCHVSNVSSFCFICFSCVQYSFPYNIKLIITEFHEYALCSFRSLKIGNKKRHHRDLISSNKSLPANSHFAIAH